ncbi:MAG: VWA domain-containing protein, partial [Phycisphaerae bacterium]
HLLARRRFQRIRWAALDFLIDAENRNRRRILMEEWLLLLLRCLAVLAIAAIISRPFLQPGGLASALSGVRQTERVFILDDSYSMAFQLEERTRFDRAKLGVRRLIETIRRDTPDDTVSILRMTNMDSPVEAGTFLNDAQTGEIFERLAALQVSNKTIDVEQVVEAAADYLAQTESVLGATVYFVSDFQQQDWLRTGAAGTQSGGVFDKLAEWGEDRALKIVCVNVAEEDAPNAAISELQLTSGQPVAGASGEMEITVANNSADALEAVRIERRLDNRTLEPEAVESVSPRMTAGVTSTINFSTAGMQSLRVALPDDRLALDDVRYLVADVASAIRVLVVNGEPGNDILTDETTLLATALRPEGEIFSGHEVIVVDEAQLEEETLSRFHVIVLANVYRVSDAAVEAIERFARNGGGVAFFLGDQVDAEVYNNGWYRGGEGVFPFALSEVVQAQDAFRWVIEDRLHPMTKGVARNGDPLGVGRIPFSNFFSIADVEDLVAGAAEGELTSSPTTVVARFNDDDGSPAITETRFGEGRVMVVTTAIDKEWGLWPDHPAYLPMVSEMIRFLAQGDGGTAGVLIGQPLEIAIDPAVHERDALLRTPSFPTEREYALTAVADEDGDGFSFRWDQTNEAGVYEFVLSLVDGGDEPRRVAVNADPRESSLESCDQSSLTQAAGSVPIDYVDGLDELSGQANEGRTELWRIFLVVATLLLMTEQFLAWRWGGGLFTATG